MTNWRSRLFLAILTPARLLKNFENALNHKVRIATPMVRRGWLENGPGPDDRRGADEYIAVTWEEAYALASGELARIAEAHGPNQCLVAPMAGRAPGVFTMHKARYTVS